jgi:hypothetical protein
MLTNMLSCTKNIKWIYLKYMNPQLNFSSIKLFCKFRSYIPEYEIISMHRLLLNKHQTL